MGISGGGCGHGYYCRGADGCYVVLVSRFIHPFCIDFELHHDDDDDDDDRSIVFI